jgi:hypothetical protein
MNGLLGSTVLELAIGVVFIYLLLAIVCTAVNEWIARMFQTRGALLKQGILQLLAPRDGATGGAATAEADIVAKFYNHPLVKALMGDDKHPSYMPARTFATVVMDLATPRVPGSITFDDLENGIKNDLPPGSLRTSLLAAIQSTNRNIDDAQRAIEGWYDDGMDRVTGWYKRKTQTWTMVLAILITIAVNADTVHIARRLWLEPALRAEFVAAAGHPPSPEASSSASSAGQLPNGDNSSSEITSQAEDTLGLVLGWRDAGNLRDPLTWFERIIGWLLTIFAISLGAPFWFDVLNRFMNLRSAGKSPEERGKPPEKPRMPPTNP